MGHRPWSMPMGMGVDKMLHLNIDVDQELCLQNGGDYYKWSFGRDKFLCKTTRDNYFPPHHHSIL